MCHALGEEELAFPQLMEEREHINRLMVLLQLVPEKHKVLLSGLLQKCLATFILKDAI